MPPPKSLRTPPRAALASTLVLASLALAQAGHAATVADATAADATATSDAAVTTDASADVSTVNELVVTARRQSEKALDVPIALTALPKSTLTQTNAYSLAAVQNLVPDLVAFQTNARNSAIGIRGVGVSSAADGLDTTVGVYVDGVYLGRPGMALDDMVDVDQVEVLNGPQGTLFGRNSAAGVVNITTAKPSFTPGATLEGSYGAYNFNQVKLNVTGPLIPDLLAARLTLYDTHRDGVTPNAYNGGSDNSIGREGARLQFLFTPSSKLSIRLIGESSTEDDTCCVTVLDSVLPASYSSAVAKQLAAFQALGYTPVATTAFADVNSPQEMRTDQHSLSAELDYDLGWGSFTSISAWRYWHFDPLQDSDGTPLDIIQINVAQTKDNQYTQEFRLASNPGRFSWQTGVFLFDEYLRDHYILNQFGTQAQQFLTLYSGTAPSPVITPGSQWIGDTNVSEKSAAVFGQANFAITDQLILTGGLRYTYDTKTGSTYTSYAGTPYKSTSYLYTDWPTTVSGGNLSYLASLSYKVTRNVMTYVSYSTGYQAAGLNLNSPPVKNGAIVLQPQDVGNAIDLTPENVADWEIGVKSSLFDHRVSINVDGFWETLTGLQANITQPGGGKSYLANVGNILTRGVEAEVDWNVIDGLTLTANGSYDDAHYTNYPNAPPPAGVAGAVTQNLTGAPVYQAPKWVVNALVRYEWTVGNDLTPYVQGQYTYRSKVFGDAQDSPGSLIQGYSLVNARAGVKFGGHYDFALWIENAFNQVYFNTLGSASVTGGTQFGFSGLLGPPRTFGATLRASF